MKKVFLGEAVTRYKAKKNPVSVNFRGSRDVYNTMKPLFGHNLYLKEVFIVAYLNKANHIMWCEVSTMGGADQCTVNAQEVVRKALCGNAQGVIIAHNHPSGALKPSENDRRITKKLRTGLKYFDIQLLDHLIFANDEYYSFSDNGEGSLA